MNYQKEFDIILEKLASDNRRPKLLIHSCCAPCSSYVLEYLSSCFEITIFYYNPNIYPEEEYNRRVEEQQMLINAMNLNSLVKFMPGDYQPDHYYRSIKGFEAEPEGGERCFVCYALRLKEAAQLAKEHGYDYFTTTLSISPHKNAMKLNELGENFAKEYGIAFLPSDFKKRNGYQRSIVLSKEFGLYRQDYCGCIYSKRDRDLNNRDIEKK